MELFSNIVDFFHALHFIRPVWFYAIIPLLLLAMLQFKKQKSSRSWQSIIDPKLLPHLLIGQSGKQSSHSSLLVFIIGLIAITSLAGPAWEKRPQPVFKEQSALVIALDLSRSMDAADIKPSRLIRARLKITDILKQRKLGQTALLVYAASAYVVSPLTDDVATITALLPSLTTDLMPAQGSRTDLAIKKAVQLLKNAGVIHGDILLVTDDIKAKANNAIKDAAKNHRISILAVATKAGAPIPQEVGGFVKDRRGAIVIPKLALAELQSASRLGKGYLSIINPDDADINRLSSLFNKNRFEADKATKKSSLKTDSWYEQGPWLLFVVIPLSLLFFRRGVLFIFILLLLQPPQPVYANSLWDSLWSNSDQRAEKLYRNNKPAEAAELFNDKRWKASAYYKDKQYEKTITELDTLNTPNAHYNRGNAFAKLGDIDKAINEYDKTLKLDPKHEDAAFNKKLLLQKKQQSDKNKKSSSKDNKNSAKQKKDSQSKQGKSKNSKQSQSNQQSNSNQKKSSKKENNSNHSDKANKDEKTEASKSKSVEKKQANSSKKDFDKKNAAKESQKTESEQDKEKKQAQLITKQWLRQIKDDPGGLLRNKFKYQYQRQDKRKSEKKNW